MLNCPYAKKCSGCQLQNLSYDKQLQYKQIKCIKLLGRFGHVDNIIGMKDPFHYRNKAQSIIFQKNGVVQKGLYHSVENKVLPIESCLLEHEKAAEITATICNLCKGFKIKPFDLYTHEGFLRHILVRQNKAGDAWMVVLVTTDGVFKNKTTFTNELLRRHPEITTLVWNINPTETPLFLGEKEEMLYGDGYIQDSLCGLSFNVSARSFYQINPIQTETLYNTAKKLADFQGDETLLDAYCGTGTIGLVMASSVKKVIGVELNAAAVRDAIQNATQNGITKAEFHHGDAGDYMQHLVKQGEKIDVCITDPPRAGCSHKFLKNLITLSPEKVIYISCNPETLARDLNGLTHNGYKAEKIIPVDLFPHTRHVETVCLLSKIDK